MFLLTVLLEQKIYTAKLKQKSTIYTVELKHFFAIYTVKSEQNLYLCTSNFKIWHYVSKKYIRELNPMGCKAES
jgi:hypothetical protein